MIKLTNIKKMSDEYFEYNVAVGLVHITGFGSAKFTYDLDAEGLHYDICDFDFEFDSERERDDFDDWLFGEILQKVLDVV